jgi:hypothetical protein
VVEPTVTIPRRDPVNRDSNLHGPRQDDELDRELRDLLRGNRPTRADEWRDQESPAEDEPQPKPGDLSHIRTEQDPQ